MPVRSLLVAAMLCTSPLPGQADALAEGSSAMARHALPQARALLEVALAQEPASYEANWRLAHVLVDLGKQSPDSIGGPGRDSLYLLAVSYARRAVAANPEGADGHFVLANALGRHALTLSRRERLRLAMEIRTEALRALGSDPAHAGAYHVLGRWHAEIMRLSGVERFVARTLMGGAIVELASWEEAERNLRFAVQHGPDRIFHRLDLARVLIDRGNAATAQDQLEAIGRMKLIEPMDTVYQREAAVMLQHLHDGHRS